jgi:hypothetical protein
MGSIAIQTQEAPSSPLNLKFDVVYAPREATPPLVGYMVVAVCEANHGDAFAIIGYEADGNGAELFRGALAEAYVRMATYLRMA